MKEISGIKFLEVPDIVKELSSSRITVLKYLREGRIHGAKIGRRWLVTEDNFRAFLRGETVPRPRPAKEDQEAS
jgi:hypothetical protein